jgi:pimeloyl-ACP methyl ester carboxylesterase
MKIVIFIFTIFTFQITLADNYLLKPLGKYDVGYKDIHLVDGTLNKQREYTCPGKTDVFYKLKKNNIRSSFSLNNRLNYCREIMLRAYYPTLTTKKPKYSKYYKAAMSDIIYYKVSKLHNVSNVALKKLLSLHDYTIRNAKIVDGKFPVILFVPGSGVEVQQYTNIITNLVSHWYIVLAFNNTFIGTSITFPHNKIVHWIDFSKEKKGFLRKVDYRIFHDILFVRQLLTNKKVTPLNMLKPYMNLNEIGILGHSIGGYSTVEISRKYPQLYKAASALDAPPIYFGTRVFSIKAMEGFKTLPFMRMFTAEWRHLVSTDHVPKTVKFQLPKNNYYVLLSPSEKNMTYTNHMSFSDYSTLQYQPTLFRYFTDVNPTMLGQANGTHIAKLVNEYLLLFFDQYLKGQKNKVLNKCSSLSADTILKCHK